VLGFPVKVNPLIRQVILYFPCAGLRALIFLFTCPICFLGSFLFELSLIEGPEGRMNSVAAN
jgi:hypothetical protein